MFFRREKPRQYTFEERLQRLREFGFESKAEGSGKARVSKLGCAAILEDVPGSHPNIGKAGVVIGDEIGYLVHGGYQMFLRTPGGRKEPALASQLKSLHDFEEDLKEGLDIISLYNQSLGTRADQHMYDRVEDRDHGEPVRPWEKTPTA
jgi:hypothetical protein